MRVLDDITVVSLEHAIAAPFATRQLADLGAPVIKVERPGGGDFARGYDARVNGLSSHFVWTNRSKESLALDLKHPLADLALARLIATADVPVQNLAPGAAARLGLSHDALKRRLGAIASGSGARVPDEEARWLRQALECMPVGFCLFDRDDRMRLWNDRFVELWQVPGHLRRAGTTYAEIVVASDAVERRRGDRAGRRTRGRRVAARRRPRDVPGQGRRAGGRGAVRIRRRHHPVSESRPSRDS